MSPTRRALLQALISLPLAGAAGSGNGNTNIGFANIIGFGGFGKRLVRKFAAECALLDRHYCALVDYVPLPDRVGPATLELIGKKHTLVDGPLVVVAGLGRQAGGELSRVTARSFKVAHRSLPVRGVLLLPFNFEGKYRRRAMEQAALFDAEFGAADRIDNQALASNGEERRLQFVARVDRIAIEKVWNAVRS